MSYDSQYSFGGRFDGSIGDGIGGSSDVTRGVFENAVTDGLLAREGGGKTMSTTAWLAKRHGVRNARSMYVDIIHTMILSIVEMLAPRLFI